MASEGVQPMHVSGVTKRGFPAPRGRLEESLHERDTYVVVRLTRHERRLLQANFSGQVGRFCLLANRDGTYDLVRYADE